MAHDAVIPYRRAVEVVDALPEHGREEKLLPLAGMLLWEGLGGLFLLNLLSTVVIVPIVGMGLLLGLVPTMVLAGLVVYPALVGLMGSTAGMLRAQSSGCWRSYWHAIRRSGIPAIGLGLLCHLYIYGYLVTISRIGEGKGMDAIMVATWLAQSAFLVLLIMMMSYAFPLLALYSVGLRPALRNSLLLVMADPLMAVGLVSLLILLGAGLIWIGLGMVLIAPIIVAVVLVVNGHLQVERIAARGSSSE